MPRGDGTGPLGEGPLTGRGFGNCCPRNGFYGRGQGKGFGRGRGAGFRGNWAYDAYDPLTLTKDEQVKILQEEKKELEEELKRINDKIKELK